MAVEKDTRGNCVVVEATNDLSGVGGAEFTLRLGASKCI